jgi:hypothetical protein
VEVDLGRSYRRFSSVVGVLDDATEAFQVGHFRVHLDGTPGQLSEAALGKPARIDVDVTGVLRLRLEMHRPGTVTSPMLAGAMLAGGQSGRLPELAWGNPTLY